MAYGLLQVVSAEELERQEREALEAQEAQEAQEERVESALAAHVRRAWDRANQAKNKTEQRLLRSQRQVNGEYDEETLQAIRKMGGSEIYMMLTATKSRAAKAWIRDVMLQGGDKPWTLHTSKEPTLPPELEQGLVQQLIADAQRFEAETGHTIDPETLETVFERGRKQVEESLARQAEERTRALEDRIEDLMVKGHWFDEFDNTLSDLVDSGTAILKAPVLLRSRELTWAQDPSGVTSAQAIDEVIPHVQRVDPFDFYPLPGVTEINNGAVIERHRLYRGELYDMIGVPGYDESAIRAVLRDYAEHGLRDWLNWTLDTSRDQAAKQDTTNRFEDDMIDALEYWGSVPGSVLERWGMDVEDPEAEYDITAWLIGRHIIKVLFNPDPMGRKPYSRACYQQITGSFWGLGVPDLIRDAQQICNAAARALVNNMGISSGPMAVVNTPSIPPGEDPTVMYPWRVFQVDYRQMGHSPRMPVEFFQPNPMTQSLLTVYDRFQREADEQAGLPSYTYGSNERSGGSASTASGLSMLMNAASKGIKKVVGNIDRGIITPTVERYHAYVMQYDDDEAIKADVDVIARGALSLVAKEQTQMRRQEFLQMTENPMDLQIMGMDGRAALLREIAKGLDMDHEEVIPDAEVLAERQQAQAQAQQEAQQLEQEQQEEQVA